MSCIANNNTFNERALQLSPVVAVCNTQFGDRTTVHSVCPPVRLIDIVNSDDDVMFLDRGRGKGSGGAFRYSSDSVY